MLKPAILYKDELTKAKQEVAYDPKYRWLDLDYITYTFDIQENNWTWLQMVSIHPKTGKVLGYLSAEVHQKLHGISAMYVCNFGDPCMTFSRDFEQFFLDLFFLFKYTKVKWGVIVGNPAEGLYDTWIKKHGGRVVGTYIRDKVLWDGTVCDCKVYEVLREEVLARCFKRRGNDGDA